MTFKIENWGIVSVRNSRGSNVTLVTVVFIVASFRETLLALWPLTERERALVVRA